MSLHTQVRLTAFVTRDSEANKSGGQPYSHRASGEVVVNALQVSRPCKP